METTGYVIRVTPFEESDAIVNLLTPSGNIVFRARGIMKITAKNSGAIQPFHYVSVDLNESRYVSNRYNLKSAKLLRGLDQIIDNVEAMSTLFTLGEIVNKLFVQDQEIAEIYPYFKSSLEAVEVGFDSLTTVLLFLAASLKVAGYGLEVNQCVNCGSKKNIVSVIYEEGGLICENCRSEIYGERLPVQIINIIRYAFLFPADQFQHIAFKASETTYIISGLLTYLDDVLGVKIKTYQDLLEIIKT